MTARACALALCMSFAAGSLAAQPASSDGPPPGGYRGPPPGGPRGVTQLFISPCGQPFRAGPGEPYPVRAWFAQADANHDGAISAEEFRADARAFFAVLDADKDGVIESDEVSRYEHQIAPEILQGTRGAALDRPRVILAQFGGGGDEPDTGTRIPQSGRSGAPAMSMEGAAPFNLLAEPEPVASSDSDFDGRISLEEFLRAADRRFHKLDRDGDGKLTLAELPRTLQQRIAESAPRRRE
jgi:Ca2+-binding EF-hand superfamily protein